jgi:hypothetical protein
MLELGPQLWVVVYLAIEGNPHRTVLVRHGLIGLGRKVDDPQAGVTEITDAILALNDHTGVGIGSPMAKNVQSVGRDFADKLASSTHDPKDPAHGWT